MQQARQTGKQRVCGWEPNGGFLTGSDFERDGAVLTALMTRDAILPILGALFAAADSGLSLIDLFARLPKRYSRAALLEHFPKADGQRIVSHFSTATPQTLAKFFTPALGFGAVSRIDTTDGLRLLFDNGEVAHVRPSGNADELRIYAVADTQARADAIAAAGIAEPDGILRRLSATEY
jgi:phosphomannomutase